MWVGLGRRISSHPMVLPSVDPELAQPNKSQNGNLEQMATLESGQINSYDIMKVAHFRTQIDLDLLFVPNRYLRL